MMPANVEKKLIAAALVSLILGLPAAAQAQSAYTFTTVDVPLTPSLNKFSDNTQINGNSAVGVAGQYDDMGGVTHGFTFDGSKFTTVDVPNSSFSALNGINAAGQLTGTYHANQDPKKASSFAFYLSSPGASLVTISPPNTVHTSSGNINAAGYVVGSYRTSDQVRHGFLWSHTTNSFTMTPFNNPADGSTSNVPPSGGTVPFGINDNNQIVGDYLDASSNHRLGFLLSNGAYTTIRPQGAALAVAEGINNSGIIVGVYLDDNGGQHGFVRLQNGTYTTVDVTGALKTEINSIDQNNQIVGYYTDASGNTHGFVGTPTDQTAMR
jgi:hypothetical protein